MMLAALPENSQKLSYGFKTCIEYLETLKIAGMSCVWKASFREPNFVKSHLDTIVVQKESRCSILERRGRGWRRETYNSVEIPFPGHFSVFAVPLGGL
jgi:hypothetical protein